MWARSLFKRKSSSFKKYGKRKKNKLVSRNNDDDDDDDDVIIGELGECVSSYNHIFFYCDVNRSNVQKLQLQLLHITNRIQRNFPVANLSNFNIFIHINSDGGDLHCGLLLFDIVKNSKIPITGIVEGSAASSATLLLLGCKTRHITRNSLFLIHQLSSQFWGNFEDFLDENKNMNQEMDMIKNIYRSCSKLKEKKISKILKRDIWWDSDKCLKYGFVDKILG
jgi:ATP-dependent protease ClpP protease subunit